MSARPRRPAGRFLAPNGRTRTKPLREVPSLGAHIETLAKPQAYTSAQLDLAVAIAYELYRGKFVLCEPPERSTRDPE